MIYLKMKWLGYKNFFGFNEYKKSLNWAIKVLPGENYRISNVWMEYVQRNLSYRNKISSY